MSPRTRALLVLLASIAVLSSAVAWQSGSKTEPTTGLLPVLQNYRARPIGGPTVDYPDGYVEITRP